MFIEKTSTVYVSPQKLIVVELLNSFGVKGVNPRPSKKKLAIRNSNKQTDITQRQVNGLTLLLRLQQGDEPLFQLRGAWEHHSLSAH